MKYLYSLIIIGCISLIAQPTFAQQDAITTYFDKYVEDEEFMVVYISPKMFEMIGKLDIDEMDEEVKDVLSDLKGLRILSRDTLGSKYYKEAISLINPKEYETLMTVRDEGENVQFLLKENEKGEIIELLLLVGGDEFFLLSFLGTIDLKKISKLANNFEVSGMEHLDKISGE